MKDPKGEAMTIKEIIEQITDAYPDIVEDESTVPHGLVQGLKGIEKSLRDGLEGDDLHAEVEHVLGHARPVKCANCLQEIENFGCTNPNLCVSCDIVENP